MSTRFRQNIEDGFFVRELGVPGHQPSVLWIHGLGESGLSFESTVSQSDLADYHHLIPDLPGYGKSAWCEPTPSFADLIDRLALWLEGRGVAPVVVVGHSMGGVLGLLLTEWYPDRVRALVNVEGNIAYDECAFSGPAAANSLEDFLGGGFDSLRDWVYRTGAESEAHRGYYASLRQADPWAFHAHSTELVELARAGDLAERMGALTIPNFYVAGVPDGVSESSLHRLRTAEVPVVSIRSAGHWPFVDRTSQFCQVLAEFLGWESPIEKPSARAI
jgi:pimeloyl-ACP methyl ester carboxylesterase